MTERWRCWSDWEQDPAAAMALDEALLECASEQPVLRFYTWKPAALSLGYFQKLAEVPAARLAQRLVRRLTGGGAIHHAAELTFALAASLEHPLYRGEVADSYARIHGALASALAPLGARLELRGERALDSDRPGTGMCFHHSSPLDLVAGARKLVGSAQRRRAGRVLHHGSLKLAADPLEPGVAHLSQELGRPASATEVSAVLRAEFARVFAVDLAADGPSARELAWCSSRQEFFESREHVARR